MTEQKPWDFLRRSAQFLCSIQKVRWDFLIGDLNPLRGRLHSSEMSWCPVLVMIAADVWSPQVASKDRSIIHCTQRIPDSLPVMSQGVREGISQRGLSSHTTVHRMTNMNSPICQYAVLPPSDHQMNWVNIVWPNDPDDQETRGRLSHGSENLFWVQWHRVDMTGISVMTVTYIEFLDYITELLSQKTTHNPWSKILKMHSEQIRPWLDELGERTRWKCRWTRFKYWLNTAEKCVNNTNGLRKWHTSSWNCSPIYQFP